MLIFAHYYAPDVASTGQILQDMAEGMRDDFDITVICVVPSYMGKISPEYQEKKIYREKINGVKVLRVPVPEFSKSSKMSRIKNILAYCFNACKATKLVDKQDYVFTISQPPIMGGMLGIYGKRKVGGKLIYCIQDFNPEQIEAVGYFKNKAVLGVMRWLDKRSCRKADLIVTVGRDLVETLKKRFEGKKIPRYTMINNWIDEKEIYPLPSSYPQVTEFKNRYDLEDKFVIMYSGNIGLYYDLEGLMRVIEKFTGARTSDGRDVVFTFVGAGAVLDKLASYQREHNLDNVVFIPYQEKSEFIYCLNAADVHWCVNARGIRGVSCPSKFYGIVGVGKPVLGVLEKNSEIEILIQEIGCGRVSEPGEYKSIAEDVRWFIDHAGSDELAEMGRLGHEYLVNHLTKDISVKKYISAIEGL